ncbi:MAG: arsenate reductase family protein [Lactobacillales bacterium]|nr:arsenate reductase family protein [Lactobacillales bacterium]
MSQNIFYWYPKCSTCQKAKKWLDTNGVEYQAIDLKTTPPTAQNLYGWMEQGNFPKKKFFNTSGMKYRELGLKDKVADLSDKEAAELLATDGMLIKRPLFIEGDKLVAIGFKEANYEEVFGA